MNMYQLIHIQISLARDEAPAIKLNIKYNRCTTKYDSWTHASNPAAWRRDKIYL